MEERPSLPPEDLSEKPAKPAPAGRPLSPPSRPDGSGASAAAEVSLERFAEVDLRVGMVVEAHPHPQADRLLVLKVDLGEAQPRQLVAGIRADWAPEQLVGRSIVVVANLKPARLRGVESQGMLLAVRGQEKVIPLGVDGPVAPGTRVT